MRFFYRHCYTGYYYINPPYSNCLWFNISCIDARPMWSCSRRWFWSKIFCRILFSELFKIIYDFDTTEGHRFIQWFIAPSEINLLFLISQYFIINSIIPIDLLTKERAVIYARVEEGDRQTCQVEEVARL